ncbi:MAG: DNA alkylation repair protein [Patescibacteria group bacterium]|nr:DNA alkylation repair protein [Patescibacteria group bacterium]
MSYEEVIKKLRTMRNKKNIAGMARFGINTENALGIRMPKLRRLAREIKNSSVSGQKLSIKLWQSKIHEARILSSIIGEADKVSMKQMNNWVKDFNSWDLCDQVCMNLFCKTKYAFGRIKIWAKSKKEYTRRAAFALLAALAVHNKKATDKEFISFFPLIKKYAADERNFVCKAVNWSLRQIGKRNQKLCHKALEFAFEIEKIDSKSAKWIARNAISELKNKSFN